jgi:Na+/serine symporter
MLISVNYRVVNYVTMSCHVVYLVFDGVITLVQIVQTVLLCYLKTGKNPYFALLFFMIHKLSAVFYCHFVLCLPLFFQVCNQVPLTSTTLSFGIHLSYIHMVPLSLDFNTHWHYCCFSFMKSTLELELL